MPLLPELRAKKRLGHAKFALGCEGGEQQVQREPIVLVLHV